MRNPEAIVVTGKPTGAGVLGFVYGEASIYLLPNTVQLNDLHTESPVTLRWCWRGVDQTETGIDASRLAMCWQEAQACD